MLCIEYITFFFPGNISSLSSVSSVENDKHFVTLEICGLVFENAFEEFSCRLFLTTLNIKETPYTYWFLVRVRNTLSFLSSSITITSHPCLCPTHTSWKSAMPISKLEKQGHSSWKHVACRLTLRSRGAAGYPGSDINFEKVLKGSFLPGFPLTCLSAGLCLPRAF